MFKTLLIPILGLLFLQSAKAQKLDTILVNMKNNGRMVATSDSADYILLVMMPTDSSPGVKINGVQEFYTNHKCKLVGTAIIYKNGDVLSLKFVGPCIDYFQNGRKKSITNYKNGFAADEKLFFPNGKLYAIEDMKDPVRPLLMECHDTTGKVLAEKGNGNWIKFDGDFKHEIEEGSVKDSLEEGEWHEIVNDSIKYTTVYKHGIGISSTDPNWDEKQIFMAVEKEPRFKSGPAGFNEYLAKAVKFPAFDRQNGTQGKVIVTFVVEKDGTLSNIKALRGPDQSMMDAAVKAIQQSPSWIPGMQNDKPVRVQYTISFTFSSVRDN